MNVVEAPSMRRVEGWFAEYGESHQDHTNKTLHWICIPLIMFSLLGFLRAIPSPLPGPAMVANWAGVAILLALVYYLLLSPALAIGMLAVSAAMLAGVQALATSGLSLPLVCLAIFVAAWIGQFAGHKIEGKKPSFFKDLQFLLIGPLWLLGFVYRKLGIPY